MSSTVLGTPARWPSRASAIAILFSVLMFPLSGHVQAQTLFTDVTGSAIKEFSTENWGASWGDYNGDSWPDLFVNNHRQRPILYRNNGNGTLTDVTLQVDTSRSWLGNRRADHHGAAFGDFDADGDDDLYIITNSCCYSDLMVSDGTYFSNEASQRGLPELEGIASAWLDLNNDGSLDLSANGDSIFTSNGSGNFTGTRQFAVCEETDFIMQTDTTGDGRPEVICGREGGFPAAAFDISSGNPVDVSATLPKIPNIIDAVAADFNNDLSADIFALRGIALPNQASLVNPTRIEAALDASPAQGEGTMKFRGGGVLTMTVFARSLGVDFRTGSGAAATRALQITLDPNDPQVVGVPAVRNFNGFFIGYNPNQDEWTVVQAGPQGWWYTYVAIESQSAMSSVTFDGLRSFERPITPFMYAGSPSGYSNQTAASGLNLGLRCVSAGAGDFDNDMDIDLYLVCRTGTQNISNRLLLNNGSGQFTQVAGAGGAAGPTGNGIASGAGTGESVAIADYDNNGFLDLFVTNGGNTQPLRVGGPSKLYRNNGNGNNWLKINLRGTTSNPDGIGARVVVNAGGVSQLREQGGGYHRWSQNHRQLHVGLGSNTNASVTINWPSGQVDSFNVGQVNRTLEVSEGSAPVVVAGAARTGFPINPGDECGEPGFYEGLDRGVFLTKDCNTGRWSVRAAAANSTNQIDFAGNIVSASALSGINGVSLEGVDRVTPQGNGLNFLMRLAGLGIDGFDFTAPSSGEVCFTLTSAGPLYFGGKHLPVSGNINLNTGLACGVSPPTGGNGGSTGSTGGGTGGGNGGSTGSTGGGNGGSTGGGTGGGNGGSTGSTGGGTGGGNGGSTGSTGGGTGGANGGSTGGSTGGGSGGSNTCGPPNLNGSTARAMYFWRDCEFGEYRMRLYSGGGSEVLRIDGVIQADNAFRWVRGYELESSDELTQSGNAAQFVFRAVGSGVDGLDFDLNDGQGACLGITGRFQVPVYAGSNKQRVTQPVNMRTLQSCVVED